MGFEIVPIKKEDVNVYQALCNSTFYDTFYDLNENKEDYFSYVNSAFEIKKLEHELSNEHSHHFWIKDDNMPVAFMKINESVNFTEPLEDDSLEIQRIYVDRTYKGIGLGKQLVGFAERMANERNKEFIWLGVWEKNLPAILFYEKIGFYKFSEHEFLFGTDKQTDYLYKKDIGSLIR
jgi:diamine N-acetyltransferase